MQPSFNPYREWLGLSINHDAPSHYELLNLPAGETDPQKIALAAEQAATKVRSFRPGSHAAQWARLLDEIQQAKLTLLDPARRAQNEPQSSHSGTTGTSHAARRGDVPAKPVVAPPMDLYPPGFRPGKSADYGLDAANLAPAPTQSPDRAASPATAMHAKSSGLPLNPPAALPVASAAPATPSVSPGYGLPVAQAPGYPAASSGNAMVASVPAGTSVPTASHGVEQQPYAAATPAIPISAGGPIDPMAPVAIPGIHLPPMVAAMPMSAMPTSGMPMSAIPAAVLPQAQNVVGAVPMPGTAIPATGAALSAVGASSLPTYGTSPDESTPQVRKASAASVMMAARKERQTRSAALLAGGAAGLVVIAGLAAYVVMTSRQSDTNGTSKIASADAKGKSDRNSGRNFKFQDTPAAKDRDDGKQPTTAYPGESLVPEVRPILPMPPTVPMPMPAAPMPMPRPAPEPEPAVVRAPEPAPLPRPTRQQVVALEASLKQARQALSEQAIDEAKTEVAKAEQLAVLPAHQQLAERLSLAIEHLSVFQQSLAEAVSKLEAAETIKVGTSTVVAIVETFPDKLTVRVNGANRSYPLAEMPAGLAAAILDAKRVGGQPDNRLLKAMYVATRKGAGEEEIAQAREWLVAAQGSDDNAAELLSFLDDTYELVKEFDAAKE